MARTLVAATVVVAMVVLTGCSALDLAGATGASIARARQVAGLAPLAGTPTPAPAATPGPTARHVWGAEVDGEALLADLAASRAALRSLHIEANVQIPSTGESLSYAYDVDQSDPSRLHWAVSGRNGDLDFAAVQDAGTLYITFPDLGPSWFVPAAGRSTSCRRGCC